MKSIMLTLFVSVGLTACVGMQPSQPIKMENNSAVDMRTKVPAAERIWYSVQEAGCRQTDSITTTTISKSPDFEAGAGRVVRGSVKERWVAHGCGKDYPFQVEFFADGRGRTDISTHRENPME